MQKYDMGISHDHGLELNNGYVVISSSFKIYLKILDKYHEM